MFGHAQNKGLSYIRAYVPISILKGHVKTFKLKSI